MVCENVNFDAQGQLFGKWKLNADTWVITNRWQNLMYLLIGEEKALLIDTGCGEGNLRAFVEEMTQKPVMVLNTHGHFDHTGGNAWWEEAWMTAPAVSIARQTFSPQQAEWFAAMPHQNYREHIVADGDKLDLGGRVVEIIAIPAHEESSVAVLDKHARLLFTGDELESGQVLLFTKQGGPPLSALAAAHKANMERLKARRAVFDFLCPAHNGTMLEPDTYLDDFIALDAALQNGTARVMPHTGGFGFPPYAETSGSVFAQFAPMRRAQHGQASIVYRVEA